VKFLVAGVNKQGKDRLSPRKEWLLIFLIMLILFTHWEMRENLGQIKQGGPVLGAENSEDDTEWDMLNMIEGVILCFAFYQCTWMLANPNKEIGRGSTKDVQ